ncbi:MAG: U32 family peptidase [Clostridia bacterium]|nr:U32 family peptidase [Clostridia bacterium]
MSEIFIKKPELLAPAGSLESLDAAIAGGADAVYFGASVFNARMNATNFDREQIERAIGKCRNFGVRSNITFNTLIYDREFTAALDEIEFLYKCGADALIVADLGLAREIKKRYPDIELHASTQMSVHNTEGARFVSDHGFDRAVIARELDRDSIAEICKNSPIETEIFIHGALCVSHSGQCLFSSLVGGRSGNRGECAQPCRLPYSGAYPLSLKDNCLAGNMSDLLTLGAASFKIEGRMKSPAYVYGVCSIYRRLIDEKRNATEAELSELARLFSRSGFTNAYFTKSISPEMNGVRTKEDKEQTLKSVEFDTKARKRAVSARAVIKTGEPATLTLTLGKVSAAAALEPPEAAINAPLTDEAVRKNLLKFGATDFVCESLSLELEDGVMMPLSRLNALRRDAVAALEAALMPKRRILAPACDETLRLCDYAPQKSARFMKKEQISSAARDYFDIIYLPLDNYSPDANGVMLPPVIFDYETENIREKLEKAKEAGAVHALVSNIGHLSLARSLGFVCHGDLRLNVTNISSANALLSEGLVDIIPSCELTLARLADLGERVSSNAVIYGRIPLMLLEKCVIKQTSGCNTCKKGEAVLTDRMGEKFPVYREGEHRNVLYNSRVTYMADKVDELMSYKVYGGHFIFTDEDARGVDKIIDAYKNHTAYTGDVRRIAKK